MQCMREQRHGKLLSKFLVLLILSIFLVSGVGCAGLSDYHIPIHSGYYITRSGSTLIELTRDQPDGPSLDVVIGGYITGYWSNNDYIVVENGWGQIVKYYIVEVATGNVSDPFETKEDLESACLELELDISEGWITTSTPWE